MLERTRCHGQRPERRDEHVRNAGFEVNIVEQFSDGVDEGKVISQDPEGNSQLEKGRTVTPHRLEVFADGYRADNLEGSSVADARKALQRPG